MVKLVIIHEEFCKLSNRDAIVSCVAHTRDVSAYDNRIPIQYINSQYTSNGTKNYCWPKSAPICHTPNVLLILPALFVHLFQPVGVSAWFCSSHVTSSAELSDDTTAVEARDGKFDDIGSWSVRMNAGSGEIGVEDKPESLDCRRGIYGHRISSTRYNKAA